MKYGTGLQDFAKQFPERFFDVGIAEEHAVTFCGGLSSMGMVPVFAVYSTFLQRAVDQIIHDLSINNSHAVIGIDRAGIVGGDGETHQGIFDVPILTSIPNTTVYSPSSYSELHLCTRKAVSEDSGICAVRYPRGEEDENSEITPCTDYQLYNNSGRILAVTYGRISTEVLRAAKKLSDNGVKLDVLRLVKIHPVSDKVKEIIASYDKVFFFEEGFEQGSVSQKLSLFAKKSHINAVTDFLPHSDVATLLDRCSLSADRIISLISGDSNE